MAISSPSSMSKPSQPSEAGALMQLLLSRGFARLHDPLVQLIARFDGWLADYELDPLYDPDFRPLADVMAVLLNLPERSWGDETAMCLALLQRDFLFRGAFDRAQGEIWRPLRESYRGFRLRVRDPEPVWETSASCTAAELACWLGDPHR